MWKRLDVVLEMSSIDVCVDAEKRVYWAEKGCNSKQSWVLVVCKKSILNHVHLGCGLSVLAQRGRGHSRSYLSGARNWGHRWGVRI